MLAKEDIVIYTAGKTWAAPAFKRMRTIGYNVNSHWIDIANTLSSPQDSFDYENQDFSYLEKMWDHGCKADACYADCIIAYATKEDGNMHSGSIAEIGHGSASYMYLQIEKPVYLVGSCQSFEKVGNSDRGWTHQRVFHKLPTDDIEEGFRLATEHYAANHFHDWLNWRAYLKANATVQRMFDYCAEQSRIAAATSQK